MSRGKVGNEMTWRDAFGWFWRVVRAIARLAPAAKAAPAPPEEHPPPQVGDRCFIYGTQDIVVIDSVEHLGIPDCYGATYLTGPKKGKFTIAYEQDLVRC